MEQDPIPFHSRRNRTLANFLWCRLQSPLRLKILSQASHPSHPIVPRALGVVMHIPRGVATCGDLASALRLPVPLPGPLPALFPPCPPRCLVTSLACDGSYFAASSCGTPSLSFCSSPAVTLLLLAHFFAHLPFPLAQACAFPRL